MKELSIFVDESGHFDMASIVSLDELLNTLNRLNRLSKLKQIKADEIGIRT